MNSNMDLNELFKIKFKKIRITLSKKEKKNRK